MAVEGTLGGVRPADSLLIGTLVLSPPQPEGHCDLVVETDMLVVRASSIQNRFDLGS